MYLNCLVARPDGKNDAAKAQIQSKFELLFGNSRDCMAIWGKKTWCEPKINKKLDDLDYSANMVSESYICVGNFEELDLNDLVWAKTDCNKFTSS